MNKDDRGFSLVELIVVVLIMAIIAVALAPQVMKWVHNSRMATDIQTRDSLKEQCQLALADVHAFDRVKNGGYMITITKDTSGNISFVYDDSTGTDITPDPSTDAYWANLLRVTGDSDFAGFAERFKIKSNAESSDIVLKVKVYEGGYTIASLTGIEGNDDIEVTESNDPFEEE